jgi:hypothetical protein
MKESEITKEEMKLAIEQPDLTNMLCDSHIFFMKEIEGKGKLLVYALKEDDSYNIQCADWLVDAKIYN